MIKHFDRNYNIYVLSSSKKPKLYVLLIISCNLAPTKMREKIAHPLLHINYEGKNDRIKLFSPKH